MNIVLSATEQPTIELSALTQYGLNPETIDRIHDFFQDTAEDVALLTYSPVVERSSCDDLAQAVLITEPLHQVPDLNGLLRAAFDRIKQGGFLICRLETCEQRKQRLMTQLPTGITHVRYVADYLLHRVAPRLFLTRFLYLMCFPCIRTISKAEAFGRLYYAGYSVKLALDSNGYLLIVAQKSALEYVKRAPSSEGVLLRIWRVGQAERSFCVFKFRTMHPYSEYLQEYLMETSGLESSGKFKDDFRITTTGKWMRKYWIDELPMLINVLRGDMKLVGVRPLSAQYFKLYPQDIQLERCRHKPGLFPPYYADLPRTFSEIVDSERRYLRAYERAPIKTDVSYLLKIGYNIFWKRKRSS